MLEIKGFSGEFRFLSNFVKCWVQLDGELYSSTEAAYQAAKTIDPLMREAIRCASTPGKAKRLGPKGPHLRCDWEDIKEDVMRDLLIQKFSQEPFTELLLKTGDAYIEETNTWGDVYWGVCNGFGKNRLGIILMEIRSHLQELYEYIPVIVTSKRINSTVLPEGFTVVDVDRSNPVLGNKHAMIDTEPEGTERVRVIKEFKEDLDRDWASKGLMYNAIQNLANRVRDGERIALRCWCAPKACHADIIKDKIVECIRDKT